MATDWPELSLDDVSELIVDCPHSTPKWTDEGVVVLRNQYIRNGRLDLSAPSYTTEEGYRDRIKRAVPTTGDLVLTREAPMGEVCQIPAGLRCCLGQRMVLVRANEEIIDPKYLLFVIQSPYLQHQISWNEGTGTTVSNIRIPNLKAFRIPTPPLSEQKQIAHILGTLDDKIELNRQMNATLEAMAQALFKSWFVDFDPVIDNALAAGNPIPEPLHARAEVRAALGDKRKPLPEAIQKQFPSSFVFSEEMGWIPEGWEVAPVLTFAKLNPESWTAKKHPEEVVYVDLANTKNGRINERVSYTFAEAPSRARRVLREDDTIVGTVRPGNKSFAFVYEEGLTGSTGFAVLRPKERWHRSYVYFALTRDEIIEIFAHLADGAAYPAIRPDVVASRLIVAPPEDILKEFDSTAYPWISSIGVREQMSESLAQTRDTLLPKLLSGQLRIPDAEKLVAEAEK